MNKVMEQKLNETTQNKNILSRRLHEDVERLINEHPEPKIWLNHLENDLMKYWTKDSATQFQNDLFPTYRSIEGKLVTTDPATWTD